MRPPHLFFLTLLLFVSGCNLTFQSLELREANKLAEANKFEKALDGYKKILLRDPDSQIALEAARRGARVSALDLKNFAAAGDFYKHIVVYSPSPEERLQAQKSLAKVYFENLSFYEQAIKEFYKLLQLGISPSEKFEYRFNIAKSFYQLNMFDQALIELHGIIENQNTSEQRFEVLSFKGNLLTALKRQDEAISVYETLLKEFPERAREESIAINLAVAFEEKLEYSKAIEVLKTIRDQYPTPDFINLRIKRLEERKANLPGASGGLKR